MDTKTTKILLASSDPTYNGSITPEDCELKDDDVKIPQIEEKKIQWSKKSMDFRILPQNHLEYAYLKTEVPKRTFLTNTRYEYDQSQLKAMKNLKIQSPHGVQKEANYSFSMRSITPSNKVLTEEFDLILSPEIQSPKQVKMNELVTLDVDDLLDVPQTKEDSFNYEESRQSNYMRQDQLGTAELQNIVNEILVQNSKQQEQEEIPDDTAQIIELLTQKIKSKFLVKCVEKLSEKMQEIINAQNNSIDLLLSENQDLKSEIKLVKEQKARLQRVCKKKPSSSTSRPSSYLTVPKPSVPKQRTPKSPSKKVSRVSSQRNLDETEERIKKLEIQNKEMQKSIKKIENMKNSKSMKIAIIEKSPPPSSRLGTSRILNSNNILESIQNMKNEFRVTDLKPGCFTKRFSSKKLEILPPRPMTTMASHKPCRKKLISALGISKFSDKKKNMSPKSLKFKTKSHNEDLNLSTGNLSSHSNLVYISPSRLQAPKLYDMTEKSSFGFPNQEKKKLKIKIKKFTTKEKQDLSKARDALKNQFSNDNYLEQIAGVRDSRDTFGPTMISIKSARFAQLNF